MLTLLNHRSSLQKGTMMNTPVVTQYDALEVASVFLNSPTVLGAELVGSVARKNSGNDLDLVLIVDTFRYASFVRAMAFGDEQTHASEDVDDEYYTGFKAARRNAALSIVALSPVLSAWLKCATRRFELDLFLMPEGWKEHVDEVQSHLPHRDPEFVSHIAADARTFTRSTISGLVRAAL